MRVDMGKESRHAMQAGVFLLIDLIVALIPSVGQIAPFIKASSCLQSNGVLNGLDGFLILIIQSAVFDVLWPARDRGGR